MLNFFSSESLSGAGDERTREASDTRIQGMFAF